MQGDTGYLTHAFPPGPTRRTYVLSHNLLAWPDLDCPREKLVRSFFDGGLIPDQAVMQVLIDRQ